MKKYLRIIPAAFQSQIIYRGSMLIRGLRDIVNVAFFILLWSALFKDKANIAGFTFPAMVTYYILVKIIDQLYSYRHAYMIMWDIKNGDLSNYLSKPLNYFFYLMSHQIGRRGARVTTSLFIVLAIFITLPSFVVFPPNIIYFVSFLFSATLSWLMVFEIAFLLGALSFWFSETSGLKTATEQLTLVLGGSWVPLNLFPEPISNLADWLPFKYLYFNLVNIYQGKIPANQLATNLSIQLLWIIILGFSSFLVWRKGITKFGAYGN